ncbi:Nucleotidyltransferase [Limnobacter sp. 130]|uniref:nucleotidyltransferase substrate binding protein n=1 Tax=Limnobacter sp. 130 TaxID=2653147 RepID=UPI0012EF2320|nr:nucleotidyltransferase substrate binding protein [Limnobacter sp. 130]VWX32778.1 Nucleotidyltransferase [Limnobacter sp. 130]
MILELSSFDNAILRLDEGIQRYEKDITDTQIRDGLIQRFEFTYELGHKMLKRFLESTSPNPAEIDELAFQDLIRTGNEQGLLLSDWTQWKKYREMRARTSHTYDESVALQVVAEIPAFLQEAKFLNAQLHSRNN